MAKYGRDSGSTIPVKLIEDACVLVGATVDTKIPHGFDIQYHHSQGKKYLGSCRFC